MADRLPTSRTVVTASLQQQRAFDWLTMWLPRLGLAPTWARRSSLISSAARRYSPSAAVLVATIRALKFHGGVSRENLTEENLEALEKGLANLDRHITNIRDNYGVPAVVSINQFIADTQAEIDLIVEHCRVRGIQVALSSHWANGGAGATELAEMVVSLCDADETPANTPHQSFVYPDSATLFEKVEAVATKIYGASEVTANAKSERDLRSWPMRV